MRVEGYGNEFFLFPYVRVARRRVRQRRFISFRRVGRAEETRAWGEGERGRRLLGVVVCVNAFVDSTGRAFSSPPERWSAPFFLASRPRSIGRQPSHSVLRPSFSSRLLKNVPPYFSVNAFKLTLGSSPYRGLCWKLLSGRASRGARTFSRDNRSLGNRF